MHTGGGDKLSNRPFSQLSTSMTLTLDQVIWHAIM